MNTPTPRTDAATYPADCLGKTLVTNRDLACTLERELSAITAERDQLRGDCENETKWAAHYLAQSIADKARAERAEADAAAYLKRAESFSKLADEAEAELAAERARLDWLESLAGMHWQWQAGITRATIDAKMKEDAK